MRIKITGLQSVGIMYNYLNETYNELDGYVLLMGVGYDKNTYLHLADARAEYPGKHLMIK